MHKRANKYQRSITWLKDRQGYTLIEMMIVISIISILATMALPSFQKQLVRAKETNLRRSLFIMRDTIDQYFADHGRYPGSLQDLETEKYIRQTPMDPLTGRSDTWVTIPPEGFAEGNIYDVHSGSNKVSLDGTPYNEW
ncbi:MAG: prepilin-type N-terminal cleavage/methylation domain-containing protein [Desulfobacteraceae bacterium]|nr:prepilin-type N-terminal cleavage/methylation domain-containing protein [Desulfobacteraceae bacterium]MBC2749243.1 prepilin-type N-terminal cleavage/methylation domain-containing protein [Desulfobacteraceae bacterium]